MSDVVRHQGTSEGDGVRCDQDVEFPDRSPAFGKDAADSTKLGSGRFVEQSNLDCRDKCIDQFVQFSGTLAIRTVPKFGQGYGADAEVGRSLDAQARANLALTAERKAHAVGIK